MNGAKGWNQSHFEQPNSLQAAIEFITLYEGGGNYVNAHLKHICALSTPEF